MGLVTLKNMLEAGHDAVGLERNAYVGGLWHFAPSTPDSTSVSVLESTRINVSRERGCFTDFPFPEGSERYPRAEEVRRYLEAYVREFGFAGRCRLGIEVGGVRWVEEDGWKGWEVGVLEGERRGVERFEKVVVCNGSNAAPVVPIVEGLDGFRGRVLHSVAYKRPEEFEGCRVMTVGLGNTAADIATGLVGVAGQVYLSHRKGSYVVSLSWSWKLDLEVGERC
jgi:dimethylaniline monooxygenase (N-oxide forming)